MRRPLDLKCMLDVTWDLILMGLSSRASLVVGRSRVCQFQLRAWRPERVARSGRPGMDVRSGGVTGCC